MRMYFDIDMIYYQYMQSVVKERIREMQLYQMQLEEVEDINSPSTLYTNNDSKQFSIKCKSFHTFSKESLSSSSCDDSFSKKSYKTEISKLKTQVQQEIRDEKKKVV